MRPLGRRSARRLALFVRQDGTYRSLDLRQAESRLTERTVWKISSGDTFAAHFTLAWMEEGLPFWGYRHVCYRSWQLGHTQSAASPLIQ